MVTVAVVAFALLVLFGYVIPWAWTGVSGNRLWEWLELLVLPMAVALTPLYGAMRAGSSRRHTIAVMCGLSVFGVIVLGGHVGNWNWTGFHGNTLWDWLHLLLLLPLLLPTIIVPALIGVTAARLIIAEEERELDAAAGATAEPDAPDGGGAAACPRARTASGRGPGLRPVTWSASASSLGRFGPRAAAEAELDHVCPSQRCLAEHRAGVELFAHPPLGLHQPFRARAGNRRRLPPALLGELLLRFHEPPLSPPSYSLLGGRHSESWVVTRSRSPRASVKPECTLPRCRILASSGSGG